MIKRVLLNSGILFNKYAKSYIEIQHNGIFTFTDSIVVEVLFKATGGDVGDLLDIVDKRDDAFVAGGKGFTLRTRGSHTRLEFGIGDGVNARLSSVAIEQNGVIHVLAQYRISDGKFQIFKDGNLAVNFTTNIGDFNTISPLRIGRISYADAEYYNGEIYMVRIYRDKFFTQDEVQYNIQNINNPITDGLILWLPFTENMGVIAKDYSGNNNHARLYNCKWVSRARRGMYFDNGGIKFDSRLNIDCNYCSVVAVFAIETLAKGGIPATGRNCIVRPSGDKLMLWNEFGDRRLKFTNYDGKWKGIPTNIDLEAGLVYTGVGIMNGNEEHIYLASNGVIIDHNYRDDLGDCGEYTNTPIFVGSGGGGTYPLHGGVLAVMTYDRPISESKIERISDLGWFDPPRDGLISWILFDGLKEGEEIKDLITGAVGEPIGTPKFVIRKPKRVLAR